MLPLYFSTCRWRSQAAEIGIPAFQKYRNNCCKRAKDGGETKFWEKQLNLQHEEDYNVFDEFQEMSIQFGFMTLFAVCMPLAPALAFVNNVIEIRGDAGKLITNFRRTTYRKGDRNYDDSCNLHVMIGCGSWWAGGCGCTGDAEDIGSWFTVLSVCECCNGPFCLPLVTVVVLRAKCGVSWHGSTSWSFVDRRRQPGGDHQRAADRLLLHRTGRAARLRRC